MPQSQYQMGMSGVSEMGQSINAIAVGLARQKYSQDILRQQMAMKQAELNSQIALDHQRAALYGAQINTEGAQQAHYGAQTRDINTKVGAAGSLGEALRNLHQYASGPVGREEGVFENTARNANSRAAMLQAIQQAGVLGGLGNKNAFETMAKGTQAGDSVMNQIMAAGGNVKNLYNNVPSGAVGVSPTGLPQINAGFNLSPDTQRYATELGSPTQQQTPQATGMARRFTPGADPRQREMATIGNVIKGLGGALGSPSPEDYTYPTFTNSVNRYNQLLTNAPQTQAQGPAQPQSLPSKEHAIQDAQEHIKKNPTMEKAVRERFFNLYGEKLP